jgi:hypothetical protein
MQRSMPSMKSLTLPEADGSAKTIGVRD